MEFVGYPLIRVIWKMELNLGLGVHKQYDNQLGYINDELTILLGFILSFVTELDSKIITKSAILTRETTKRLFIRHDKIGRRCWTLGEYIWYKVLLKKLGTKILFFRIDTVRQTIFCFETNSSPSQFHVVCLRFTIIARNLCRKSLIYRA